MEPGTDTWRRLAGCGGGPGGQLDLGCGLKMRKAAGELSRDCLAVPRSALPNTWRVALDIGGSLAKVAYFVTAKENEAENEVQLHLMTFDLEQLEGALVYIRDSVIGSNHITSFNIRATGVGCKKYRDKIKNILTTDFTSDDREMHYTARGLDFMWRHLSESELLHEESHTEGLRFRTPIISSGGCPMLLVNLGSAMTAGLITEYAEYDGLVGCSTLGGLSFLGLGYMLTKAKSFKDLMGMAEVGDHRNVDLLVGDTAGSSYYTSAADGMVSSFGKAVKNPENSKKTFKEEDIANSLLHAVTDNIAIQIYLSAKIHNVHLVAFTGSYLAGNSTIMSIIKNKFENLNTFPAYDVKPIFMKYESYMGVLGLLFDDMLTPATNGDHS